MAKQSAVIPEPLTPEERDALKPLIAKECGAYIPWCIAKASSPVTFPYITAERDNLEHLLDAGIPASYLFTFITACEFPQINSLFIHTLPDETTTHKDYTPTVSAIRTLLKQNIPAETIMERLASKGASTSFFLGLVPAIIRKEVYHEPPSLVKLSTTQLTDWTQCILTQVALTRDAVKGIFDHITPHIPEEVRDLIAQHIGNQPNLRLVCKSAAKWEWREQILAEKEQNSLETEPSSFSR